MPFNLGTIWAEIGLNTKKLDDGLMAANVKLATADKSITTFGQKLTAQSTKLMTIGGLMSGAMLAAGTATVKMASQFDTSMRNVNSISKLSEVQFKALSDQVLTLSTKMPQSAKVLADGLYDIASSGFSGADGMKVLEASAKAASAGMTDTATSAKGVTAVLNAYGFEAEEAARVSDTMFKTVDKGVITFEELSSTVGDWVGMAKAANLSFEEASGAIAYMTTKGIGAAEAGTSLQRMLTGIIKPSEEMAAVIKNAGYESGEMMLKTLGLTGTMKVLNDTTGGSITKLIELMPEIRGVRGANALLGAGYEELTDYMEDFNNTAGATNTALAEQSKSLDYQMKLLKNNANAVVIALGSELIPSVNKYVTSLTQFIQTHKDAIVEIVKLGGAAVGAVGGILLLAGALGKLRAVVLAHPVAALIAAFVALNGIVDVGAGKLEDFDNAWGQIGGTLLRTLASLTSVKKGMTDNVSVAQALAKGWITVDEAARYHVGNYDTVNKKIAEATKAEEELANGIYDSIEAYQSAQTFIRNYSDEVPIAAAAMDDLIGKLNNGEISAEAFAIGIEELRKATQQGKVDIEQQSGAVGNLANDFDELTKKELREAKKAQEDIKPEIEETTKTIEEQREEVDNLRSSFNQLIDDLFGHITTYNDFEEAGWAVQDAEKALAEAIKEHGAGSREAAQAQNELDATNLNAIETAFELSTAIGATTQQQEEARRKAVELGLQYVSSGLISEEAFIKMATQFGLSAQEISTYTNGVINPAIDTTQGKFGLLGGTVATPKITVDTSEANKALDDLQEKLNSMNFKVYQSKLSGLDSGYSMGGVVKAYAGGGIVSHDGAYQPMLTAASGMVVPQTGRAVPVMAHEYEIIANTSQQRNLAEWIMDKANSRPDGSGGKVIENLNIYSPSPITPAEVARQTKNTLRLYAMEAALQ